MNMNLITLEKAIEVYMFGWNTICDGDKHEFKYRSTCNHCNKTFESDNIDIYCDKCSK